MGNVTKPTITTKATLEHTIKQEKEYDWLGAAESYKELADTIPDSDHFRLSDFSERIGYAYYKAALQAETSEDFKNMILLAISSYQRAEQILERLRGEHSARKLRSDAWIHYLKFWLATDPSSRKSLLNESWNFVKESLNGLDKNSASSEYGSTFNKLSRIAGLSWLYETDPHQLERTLTEGVEYGRRAIKLLSNQHETDELAKAYTNTASFLSQARWFVPLDGQRVYEREARENWSKARELSEESASSELSAVSFDFIGPEGSDEALRNWKRALELGQKSRDKLSIASALAQTVYHTAWRAVGTEDPDERTRLMEEALRTAEEDRHQSERILLPCPITAIMWPESPQAEYYYMLGIWETDLEKRRELWAHALEKSPEMFQRAHDAGYHYALSDSHHVYSKVLASAAKFEKNPGKREDMLTRALEERNLNITLSKPFEPFAYFNHAVSQHYLAEIEYELSNISGDASKRKSLLQDAIRDKEECVETCRREMLHPEEYSMPHVRWIGERVHEYGKMLVELYELDKDEAAASKALESFSEAAAFFEKANISSRMAESYWRLAQLHDELGDPLSAAESFLQASKSYSSSAEKIPQLRNFYRDHSSYMETWSFIEKAKYNHGRQDFKQAEDFYNKASELLRSTNHWTIFAPNYSAWARLERAEDLSQKGETKKAAGAFQEADQLFRESKKAMEAMPQKASLQEEEQHLLSRLVKQADLRGHYCTARVRIEEAKDLDKEGEHHLSAEKYGSAATILDKILGLSETEGGLKEVRLIMTLSKAWQLMARAEAEVSPLLYLEASRLFEEAKELSGNEKARMLALGHSRFCRALEAGARFADTGDEAPHSTAVQQLESAANYYLRAGFQNASEYAEASKLLFDAYSYMNKANREDAHEGKARLFALAEKMLSSSADLFEKAGQSGRRDQVTQLLEKVKKQRDLAVSLTQVLHAPPVMSTTAAFQSPTPTYEKPVGLDRFDHADVQASMITRARNLKVGESFELEIELVNAGKGAAQLVKVEEVVPEGFDLTPKADSYRVEDSFLNMRGKRLDPLKTEEVKVTLRPRVQGQFMLKPRILYIDEGGKYKSHEPEPIAITVKELGISGWIRGR